MASIRAVSKNIVDNHFQRGEQRLVGRHPKSGLAIPTQVDQQANKATTDRIDHGSKLTKGHNGDHKVP